MNEYPGDAPDPCLVAAMDPPWDADNGGGGKGANHKYPTMGVDAIARVVRMSPPWTDTGNALVFMWATTSAVLAGDAHALANLLHLRPCAQFIWAKAERVTRVLVRPAEEELEGKAEELAAILEGTFEADVVGANLFRPMPLPGIGQWTRCEHEHLLVCRRGDVQVPSFQDRQRSVIYAPRGEHSAKPEEAWAVIEATALSSTGLRAGVEFFARHRRRAWGAWGHLDGAANPARYERAGKDEA